MMLIFSRQDTLEKGDTCKGVFDDVPSIHVFDKRIGWTTHFYEYNEVQSSVPYSRESQTTMFMETWGKCIPSFAHDKIEVFLKKEPYNSVFRGFETFWISISTSITWPCHCEVLGDPSSDGTFYCVFGPFS